MRAPVIIVSLAVLVIGSSNAAADVVQAFKDASFSYRSLQIAIKFAESGVARRNDICTVADEYDRVIADVDRMIDQGYIFQTTGSLDLTPADITELQTFRQDLELDLRRFERRCR
jgi:hypothetical protein